MKEIPASNPPPPRNARATQVVFICALAVIAVGALTLLSWATRPKEWQNVLPGLTTMKANTALALIVAGISLWLLRDEGQRSGHRAGRVVAALVLLIAALTLGEYVLGRDFGIDQLLFTDDAANSYPGRMGLNTAVALLLLGGSLLGLDARTLTGQRLRQLATLCGMVIAGLALLDYIYGISFFARVLATTTMALYTAVCLLLLGAGLLVARPQQGVMNALTGDSLGSALLRRLLPATITLLLVLGWLWLEGERRGLYQATFGTALLIATMIVLLSLLLWWSARVINHIDGVRQAANERMRVTLSSIGDAVIATDVEGRISFLNPVAEVLTGWLQHEAIGRPLPEVFHIINEKTGTVAENPVERVFREGSVVGLANHTILIARDGLRWPIDDSGAPIRDANGRVIGAVLVFRDVVERRQAEMALAESEARLRRAVVDSPIPVLVHAEDDRILLMSKGWTHYSGYTFEELQSNGNWTELAFGERNALAKETIDRLFEANETVANGEWEITTKDGRKRTWDFHTTPLGRLSDGKRLLLSVANDVTQRKASEEEARRLVREVGVSNATLDALINNAPIGIGLWDRDIRYLRLNDALAEINGLPKEAHLGKTIRELLPEIPAAVTEMFRRVVERGESFPNQEVAGATPAAPGQLRYWSVNYYPVRVADEIIGAGAICEEITARKAAEAEREELMAREQSARHRAEEANRLKDEFLAVVSHELRTPLNAINGYTQLLRALPQEDETARQYIETIDRNVKTQMRLVEDLLDTSRIITDKLRLNIARVDLRAIIEAALETARPAAAAKQIAVVADLAAAPSLTGDPARLQQIVWNLLSNAVKFTPEGGSVAVLVTRAADHVEIVVSDTGEGIAPEFLPYVFDRFRQADSSARRQHRGLGLGLSIVHHLVEMHGGSVSARSDGAGTGATFIVRLPLQAAIAEPTAPAATRATEEPTLSIEVDLRGLRALVVDDEPDARELVRAILAAREMEVATCASTREALARLPQFQPNVLVSDIGLPREDGYVLISEVRALDGAVGQVPAIALTAYARSEDRARAFAAGYQSHIPKPIEPEELIVTIASLTGRL